MRTGKTTVFFIGLAEHLKEGKSYLVAGAKEPQTYIDRLKTDFNIDVEVIPHYAVPSLTNRFHIEGDKLTEYLPTLSGYEFKIKL